MKATGQHSVVEFFLELRRKTSLSNLSFKYGDWNYCLGVSGYYYYILVAGMCVASLNFKWNVDSGMQDAADATMEVAKTLNEKISKYCLVTIETCAYAGTGNVLKVSISLSSSFGIHANCYL